MELPPEFYPVTGLFSESGGYLLEVDEGSYGKALKILGENKADYWIMGMTVDTPAITVRYQESSLLSFPLEAIKNAWNSLNKEKVGTPV